MDDHSFEAIRDDVHRLGVARLAPDDSGDVDALLAVVKELPRAPDAWMLQRGDAGGEVKLRMYVVADNTLHRIVGSYRIVGDPSKPDDQSAQSACAYDAIPVGADASVEVQTTRSPSPGHEPLRLWHWRFHLGGGAEPIELDVDPRDEANREVAELTLSFARSLMGVVAARVAGAAGAPPTAPAPDNAADDDFM